MSGLLARITAFFASSAIKYWLIGIGAVAIVGTVGWMYWSVTHTAAENARLTAEVAAKQRVIEEQDETIAHQKALMKLQQAASKELDDDISVLSDQEHSINEWLQSPDVLKHDRPSSLILKKTIEKLGAK
jgi:hypothetical protein